MCEACKHMTVHARQDALKKADPTRTTTLRNAFEKQMRKRFADLMSAITDLIVKKDVFGLTRPGLQANVQPGAFNFSRSSDKVEAFMEWLKEQEQLGILKTGVHKQFGTASETAWTSLYIEDSAARGIQRADYEMTKLGMEVTPPEQRGGAKAILNTPFHADRVGLLYTRVYNDLVGITDTMNNQISRVLSQAMVDGDHPSRIARKLNAVIKGGGADLGITDTLGRYIPAERRARMLARTEVIRAHHVATIQEYRNWGVAGVSVLAEWSTAGDNRVCDQCKDFATGGKDGKGIYTLDEIEPMIPVHPNCRCMALPYLPKEGEEAGGAPVEAPAQTFQYSKGVFNPNNPAKYWEENGWDVIDNTTDAAGKANFMSSAKGFNFQELDEEMLSIFEQNGIDLVEKKIVINQSQQGVWDIAYKGLYKGDEVEVSRMVFGKKVIHGLFELPVELQGKGMSKKVLSAWYKQYQSMKVSTIELAANLEVGGYSWARYGFAVDGGKEGAKELLEEFTDAFEPGDKMMGNFKKVLNAFYKNNSSKTNFPMNLWSDIPGSKNYLLGSDWYGNLNMSDPVQVSRFESYLFKK